MKKLLFWFIFFLIYCSMSLMHDNQSKCKVFNIISPTEIFIDINNNLIFDEKEPVKVNNIYYINDEDNIPEFNELSSSEKFFLKYKAIRESKLLLKNKYVIVRNNIIYVDSVPYNELLMKSGFFYDNTEVSKENLIRKIKEYDLNEYVIYNTRSKKYHNIDCPDGQKSKEFKIIKKSALSSYDIKCKKCIVDKKIIKAFEVTHQEKLKSSEFSKENIDIFFIDINSIFLPSKKCETIACKTLKNEIDNAKDSIDFAIYGLNNQPEIFNAILNAYKRGVNIRFVTDFDKQDGNYYKDTLRLIKLIPNHKTDEEYDLNYREAIMHNKFFIFDNQKVYTGSANITSTGITGFNSNIVLLINSKDVANVFKQEFEQMYSGLFHTHKQAFDTEEIYINNETKIKTYFSPQDKVLTTKIIPLLRNAKEYIYIPVFFITKKELISELIDAHNRGVEVKIINDATNAQNKYSIHKDLRKAGIKVKTENFAGKLHSKTIIIDDKYSIIGSMNFSNNGEKRNDENTVIIEDTDIAKYLKSVFIHLWNKIPTKYERIDAKPESIESIGSCFDKIDNDYDGKIDGADNGCRTN